MKLSDLRSPYIALMGELTYPADSIPVLTAAFDAICADDAARQGFEDCLSRYEESTHPNYDALFADAAKAGEGVGLPEDKAILYAAQTLKGAAELLLTSGESPEILRQRVCSPKGSTIEGVEVLLNSEFDNIVNDTVKASFKRTKELGK